MADGLMSRWTMPWLWMATRALRVSPKMERIRALSKADELLSRTSASVSGMYGNARTRRCSWSRNVSIKGIHGGCSVCRILISRRGLCGSTLWTMTLRAVLPERKTSEVTPSEMGEQFTYEPMLMPDSGAGGGEDADRGDDDDGGSWCLPGWQAEVYSFWGSC